MKIAISSTGHTLDAEMDPRFGRCQYFILIDTETMQFEAIENASGTAAGGAGISAAQMVASKGVQAVLTGNCGPNAYNVLSAAGIQVITGVSGKVKDVIQSYKSGQFQTSSQANVSAHFGSIHGVDGNLSLPHDWTSRSIDTKEELNTLRGQTQVLEAQLSAIQSRIEDLGKK